MEYSEWLYVADGEEMQAWAGVDTVYMWRKNHLSIRALEGASFEIGEDRDLSNIHSG